MTQYLANDKVFGQYIDMLLLIDTFMVLLCTLFYLISDVIDMRRCNSRWLVIIKTRAFTLHTFNPGRKLVLLLFF